MRATHNGRAVEVLGCHNITGRGPCGVVEYTSAHIAYPDGTTRTCDLRSLSLPLSQTGREADGWVSALAWVQSPEWLAGVSFEEYTAAKATEKAKAA